MKLSEVIGFIVVAAAIVALPSLLCAEWPANLDISYSADNPPGPSFSDGQKHEQRKAGLKLLADLRAAYAANADSFTIPPGDYRFGTARGGADSFELRRMDRDGRTPFRILGRGATLWFDLGPESHPKVNYMVQLFDCANITLEGLTIDSDPRGCMDTRVTDFDFEGNRIQVEPLEGTQLLERLPTKQNRFVPFKSNGRHIAALYNIDGGWGPRDVCYTGFSRTENGKYWFEMETDVLLKTIRDPAWLATYGREGTLEKGDVLTFLWSVSFSIELRRCKQITVRDCTVYAAKAVSYETGYGGNKWLNCRFMPRPGTNNLLGGEGRMSSECRVGSLVDGQVHLRTSDDAFMYRALWRYAVGVTPDSITFHTDVPELLASGHKAAVFDKKSEQSIGRLTIESVEGRRTVRFKEPIGDQYADCTVLFADFMNAGWKVRNSLFLECYQSTPLIQCGPGLFENNRVERAGAWVRITPGVVGLIEGGIANGVVFRDNVFVDSFVCPANPGFFINGQGPPLSNLTLEGNLICNTGREAVKISGARDVVLRDNTVVNPFEGRALMPEKDCPELPAFHLEQVDGAKIENNIVVRRDFSTAVTSTRSSANVVEKDNQTRVDQDEALETRIRELIGTPAHDAKAILKEVRAELNSVPLLDDLRFERGFKVWSPVPGKKTEQAKIVPNENDPSVIPVWGLAQWHSRFTLANAERELLPDGRIRFRDGAKAVTFFPLGHDIDISFALNGWTEYRGKAPNRGDPWPHLLADRELLAHPNVSEIAFLPLVIRYRLKKAEVHRPGGFDPRRHTAQFVFYLTVQNRNRQSDGFGDYYWFGVPLYDARYRIPKAHKAVDKGSDRKPATGKFIFNPGGERYTAQSAHDGDWVKINKDLASLIREGLATAWENGFLQDSRNPADYRLMAMNTGWEVTGPLDVEMELAELRLSVVTAEETGRDK